MAEKNFRYRILLADDDPSIRETSALVLMKEGFEVRTCEDGFSALILLRSAPPDLIISDLRMPNMSGFELLSIVRRRFPQIPVIAISGEFDAVGPSGLLADAFFQKGAYRPGQLFIKIAALLKSSPLRASIVRAEEAFVWVPLNDRGYCVLTCTECLRSFPEKPADSTDEICAAVCIYCGASVRYLRQFETVRKRENNT